MSDWNRDSVVTRREGLIGAFVLSLFATAAHSESEGELQKIRIGTGDTAIETSAVDLLVPQYLGYYQAEGLTTELLQLGTTTSALAGLDAKRIEFYATSAQFILPIAATDDKIRSVDFFELLYPFRYSLAVNPGSPFHSIADLRDKRIGISAFGKADYSVARGVFRAAGFDPDKDVSWLAVGEGIRGGLALQRGDVDALLTFNTTYGVIEAAKIPVTYLPLPPNLPKIGGYYLATSPDLLHAHRAWAVGIGRAVAKAHVFIRENPEAAAYIFAEMVPEALPKGESLEEQVKSIMAPVVKQMSFYTHYDPSIHKAGYIKASEWQDEINFLGLQGKIPNVSSLFTDDLIDEINQFDVEKVKTEARAFKIPYKS